MLGGERCVRVGGLHELDHGRGQGKSILNSTTINYGWVALPVLEQMKQMTVRFWIEPCLVVTTTNWVGGTRSW